MSICPRCLIGTEDLANHLCLPSPALSGALAAAYQRGLVRGCEDQRNADVKTFRDSQERARSARDKATMRIAAEYLHTVPLAHVSSIMGGTPEATE